MKKYMTLAALLAAGTAFANAANVLPDGTWTTGDGSNEMSTSQNWQVGNFVYTLTDTITLSADDVLNFSFDFYYGSSNTIATLALVGSSQAVVVGHGTYNTDKNIQVGLSTDVTKLGYSFSGSNDSDVGTVTASATITDGLVVANASNGDYTNTISGTIKWSADGYVLTVGASAVTDTVSVNLGDTVDVTSLAFATDGVSGALSKISNVKLSVVPEPSAFGLLAGLGALALVASRRRRK